MADSSSLSDAIPSRPKLEQGLRNAVQQVYKTGNLENLTVKRIRKLVEDDLELPEDFFKSDATWKEKSKELIQAEVDAHTEAQASSQPPPSSSLAATPNSPAPSKSANSSKSEPKGQKRASEEMAGSKQKKRRKQSTSDVDQSANEGNGAATKKERSNTMKLTPRASPPAKIEADLEVDEPGPESKSAEAGRSESEMSELIDEAPKPKGRPRTSDSAKPKARKSEGKNSSEQRTDPDADEIKRLQGWLIKCGIRKMWHRELATCETSKAKIRHLKEMLSDAGMTGRFSAEKASQIREERELKADLEAVQEGAKQWGKEDEEAEVTPAGRPKRRLARGFEGLDFLNDDDGEESD